MKNEKLNKDAVKEIYEYLGEKYAELENKGYVIQDIIPDIENNKVIFKCYKPIDHIKINMILYNNGKAEIIKENEFTSDSFYWNDKFND